MANTPTPVMTEHPSFLCCEIRSWRAKVEHISRSLSSSLSYLFPPLPTHTTKIVLCVLSPQSLFMPDWTISSVWLLSMGRNSMRLFAPELLCNWHSVKQKRTVRWLSLKTFTHCSRTRSSSWSASSSDSGLELHFAALVGSVTVEENGKIPSWWAVTKLTGANKLL